MEEKDFFYFAMLRNLESEYTEDVLFIFLFLLSLIPPSSAAKFSPETAWESSRTEHFRIHSPASYRSFSGVLGGYLEEAYVVLSKELHWELRSVAEVVVRGDTDSANGLTQVFPMNRIIIHPVPFPSVGSMGEYDHWIRTLAYHELTHLIANDTTTGLFSLGRLVFGSAAKMNPYQPQWLVEGLAVYQETAQSRYGRGRSAFVDMALRSSVLEEALGGRDPLVGVTLDRLNDGPPLWPGPLAPYYYGYVLQEMMVEAGGKALPGLFSFHNSGRLPFFLNGGLENLAQISFYGLWDRAVERVKKGVVRDLAAIRGAGATQVNFLSEIGRMSRGLTLSPNGDFAFLIRDSYNDGTGLARMDLKTRAIESLSSWDADGGSQLRALPSGVLYSRLTPFNEYSLFSDVFVWDFVRDSEVRLTEGFRASDPDGSADLRWDEDGRIVQGSIVYVKNGADANQSLVLWDGRAEKVLYAGKDFERISTPAWGRGPARDWIVFGSKKNGENERLLIVSASGGAARALSASEVGGRWISEVSPSWSEKGDLYFSSSRDGVFNLYQMDFAQIAKAGMGRGENAYRVTRLETGALSPAVSADGRVFAMAYRARGFDVAGVSVLAREASARPSEKAARLQLAYLNEKLREKIPVGDSKAEPLSSQTQLQQESYSIFPAILPKYWQPFGQRVADGWNLGVMTSGHDALEFHNYQAQAAWDSRARFPVYLLAYQYEGLYPSIQIERKQENKYLGLEQISNRVATTSVSLEYPVGDWGVGFGASWSQSRLFEQQADNAGLEARFSYGRLRIFPDSIDREMGEKGSHVDIVLNGYFLGDDQFSAVGARLEQRVPSFWKQHFFRFVGQGARSSNQDLSASYYVGGGEPNIASSDDYLLRGYTPGAIYGRSLATFNAEYWMPLWNLFRGIGTIPVFFQRTKLKLFLDTGSAEIVSGGRSNFAHWPVGTGAHLLQDVKLFYRFPVTLALGFDWGLSRGLGGEKQVVIGVFGRLGD